MGTRGAFGVVIGEEEKIGYNQFDSYPEGCGLENLRWLRKADLALVRELASAAQLVDDGVPPSAAEIKALQPYTDLNVSRQTEQDWYCLTRETHGSFGRMLSCGYIYDSAMFPLDSLFCEWAYMLDLDNEVFEVYTGFQKAKHNEGRFADRVGEVTSGYWPVRLVKSWPLDALPTDEEFLSELEEEEEDDG